MIQKIANIFTVRKQKKYILAVSDTFPMWHSRALESTHFASMIKAEKKNGRRKIHDIRTNSNFWEEASRKINAGKTSLRVCYMVDEIEEMKYHPITLLCNIGVQKLLITTDNKVFIDGKSIELDTLARNEGLNNEDFLEWYGQYKEKKLSIIHFTEFRY